MSATTLETVQAVSESERTRKIPGGLAAGRAQDRVTAVLDGLSSDLCRLRRLQGERELGGICEVAGH